MSYVDDVEDRTHTVAGRMGEGVRSFLKIRYEVHLKLNTGGDTQKQHQNKAETYAKHGCNESSTH